MRAAVFRGAGRIEVCNVAVPRPGPDEALLRVHYCGICGSDVAAFRTGMYEPGLIIGHEFSGAIVGLGNGVRGWRRGEEVAVNGAVPCAACLFCRRNLPSLCDDLLMPGVTLNGGMAEYAAVPARSLHRLPLGLSTRRAALAEPLAVVLHGIRRSAFRIGDRPLVVGAGPIGLLSVQCLQWLGASEVFVSEKNPARAALARQLGATAVFDPGRVDLAVELAERTAGRGPEIIFLCTGSGDAFEAATALLGKGGQILLVGRAVEELKLDGLTLVLHELNVQGSYLGHHEFPEALDALVRGLVAVEPLISREIGLDNLVPEGLEALQEETAVVKILVNVAGGKH